MLFIASEKVTWSEWRSWEKSVLHWVSDVRMYWIMNVWSGTGKNSGKTARIQHHFEGNVYGVHMGKEELLASIKPDMILKKDFIKKIYGFEISYPGFSERAITALEAAGCSKARQYYEEWVRAYEAAYHAELKVVANWYGRELKKRQKEGEKRRRDKQKSEQRSRERLWMRLSEILDFQLIKTEK